MKKHTVLSFTLALALLLTACSSSSSTDKPQDGDNNPAATDTDNDNKGDQPKPQAPENPVTGSEPQPPVASGGLSSDPQSHQFQLEGRIYTLPILYSELEADGWGPVASLDLDQILEVNTFVATYSGLIYHNDTEMRVSVQFANLTDKDIPLRECHITGVLLTNIYTTQLIFPGGISHTSSDDIKALYGEPTEIKDYGKTADWVYKFDRRDQIVFSFHTSTEVIDTINMQYLPQR